MKILIIGGNGFIGSHLVDVLLQNNHQVRVFDMAYERYRMPLKNVDYRIGDLDDITALYEALLGVDIVYHLASASVPSTSNIDAVADVSNNLISTLNILNALVKAGVKRLVYFSSGGAVYGITEGKKITESQPFQPISSYGIIKATIEQYIGLYRKLHGIQALIVRPSNPYGPRQGHFIAQGVISTFLKKAQVGEPISIFGDGLSLKDYIYIDDLVKICYHLSLKRENGIYNIGSGKGASLLEIVEYIKDITNKELQIVFTEFKPYDVSNFVLNINKVKAELGEYSFVGLKQGIQKTWQWICENNHNKID